MKDQVLQTLKNFFNFIKKPTTNTERLGKSPLVILFVIDFIFAIVISALIELLNIEIDEEYTKELIDMHPIILYALAIILAPLIEESMFRLPMRSTIVNVNISLLLILLTLFNVSGFYLFLMVLLLLANISVLLIKNYEEKLNDLNREKYFKYYFHLMTLSFAVFHIELFFNEVDIFSIILLPVYIFGSYVLGYIRMTNGIKYAIIFHAIWNLLSVTLFYIAE